MMSKPSKGELRWIRSERLRRIGRDRIFELVCESLRLEWEQGRSPARILMRPGFVRLPSPLEGPWSDRKLPPADLRPPSTRLIAKTGSAQETFLTLLFVSQCTTAPGKKPATDRPVLPRASHAPGTRTWASFLAVVSERSSRSARTYVSTEENKTRQIDSTLKRLESAEIGLLDFPNAHRRAMKHDGFRILVESGRSGASRVPYEVPTPAEAAIGLPAAFFLNGWHLILSDSEVALLLAVYAHRGLPGPWEADEPPVVLEGEVRIRSYGLSPDAYRTHQVLEACDVLAVTLPDRRSPVDGTWRDFGQDEGPMPHRLKVLEAGFDKPALPVMLTALQNLGISKPDGRD